MQRQRSSEATTYERLAPRVFRLDNQEFVKVLLGPTTACTPKWKAGDSAATAPSKSSAALSTRTRIRLGVSRRANRAALSPGPPEAYRRPSKRESRARTLRACG